MARIVLDGISKTFPDGTHAVRDLDLDIQDGELMVLVGPSGCGKTTALRMVAGLEEITSGTISIDGRTVNDVEPRERDVAMVFQSYALYPHLTVYENMAFSLRYRKTAKDEIDRRVRDVARVLEVDSLLDRRPRQLSGGQRQRVAMGRAIVRQPKAFLMDEPLSNLDAQLRVQMRSEIARLQHSELGVTTIYVTHDQTEGMTLGDRVAVLSHGILQQLATPQELYARPVNVFVAGFIGSPGMNLVEARLRRDGDRWDVDFGGHHVRVPAETLGDRPALAGFADRPVIVGVRPENIEDAAFVRHVDPEALLDVEVALREELGSEVDVLFRPGAAPVVATPVASGDEEDVATIRSSTMIARLDPRSKATEGERIRLQVDTGTLQFFDPETGQRIEG